MPELPEVETVVRDLRPLLCGRRIVAVSVGRKALRFKWQRAWTPLVVGCCIESVSRRGKWLLFGLDDGSFLLGHLGMTGQMRVVPKIEREESHTHLIFSLDDGREWRYRDVRRFGGLRRCTGAAAIQRAVGERLGPEPWHLDPKEWRGELARSKRSLKAILLDQSVVAGVGNIYADECLFLARLWPKQPGTVTTAAQAERLRLAMIEVLERAIASRGSTIRDYVGGSGLSGEYQDALNVYGRTNKPCPNCQRLVQCIRLAGRSSHYCPGCQKPSRPKTAQESRPTKRLARVK
jgi:formamidopyrimidine-DNA glycosylase